jgi:hypothetical protein
MRTGLRDLMLLVWFVVTGPDVGYHCLKYPEQLDTLSPLIVLLYDTLWMSSTRTRCFATDVPTSGNLHPFRYSRCKQPARIAPFLAIKAQLECTQCQKDVKLEMKRGIQSFERRKHQLFIKPFDSTVKRP